MQRDGESVGESSRDAKKRFEMGQLRFVVAHSSNLPHDGLESK